MNLDVTDWIIVALVALAVVLLLVDHLAQRWRTADERFAGALQDFDNDCLVLRGEIQDRLFDGIHPHIGEEVEAILGNPHWAHLLPENRGARDG